MQKINEDTRANYAYAAFVGWQLGAGSGKMTVGEKKALKSKALEYAAKVIARDKKRKKE